MTGTAVAVVCALTAALLVAVGSIAQQRSAAAVPESDAFLSALIRSPRWWAGILGDGGSYLLQVAALAFGSVLLVQPLLVASLLFALPLAATVGGYRIARSTWVYAAALCAALAIFVTVGNPTAGTEDAPVEHWLLPLAIVLAAVGLAVAAARTSPRHRALLLGAAGGISYGVAAAFTKHVTDRFDHGLVAVATTWQTWALVAAGLVGTYLQQRAFRAGSLSASMPALTIGEPLAAIFLGMTVLGEHLQVDGPHLALVLAAIVTMLVTTVVLSRQQAEPLPAAATGGSEPPPETPNRR